ncbi:MAG: polysaccharide biosynthesis/export family protein [Odoribacter sp.]|nr:polysaccharide biosynthesis/export family protein [Odoribacter sp.]
MLQRIFQLLVAVALFSGCAAPKIAYFQDVYAGSAETIATGTDIRVQPEDKISIVVNSRDPLLTNLFNLPVSTRRVGETVSTYRDGAISGYTIDKEGNIDFPVLGKLHIGGMNREEIVNYIKEQLISQNLVKDPVVTVEFMNLSVSVLGEVTRPGRYNIDKDRMTLLDAISMAGDLTVYGLRNKVMVQREENGKQNVYVVDLTSAKSLYSSPVYYLKQNDLVYVEPNDVRARQSTVNGNNIRSSSFWVSIASLLTSVLVLIVR